MSDVEIIEVNNMPNRKAKEPIMPSKESSELDLGEELVWKHEMKQDIKPNAALSVKEVV